MYFVNEQIELFRFIGRNAGFNIFTKCYGVAEFVVFPLIQFYRDDLFFGDTLFEKIIPEQFKQQYGLATSADTGDHLNLAVVHVADDLMLVTIYDMLNELKSYKNLDVYVTGSNSKMLSSDIATEFRGRATQIRVYPFSFGEFYSYVGGDERKALEQYMLYGGMPRVLQMTDDQDKKNYLTNLYSELYVKDIVERNGIEREDILNNILDFLASQISSLTNPTNVANAIASMRQEKINSALVSSYINHTIDAFLIRMAQRYDVKGKSYFNYPNKYYYTDIGLRNARLNYRQYDPGHIMENIIYNDLIRRGYSVDVGVVVDRRNGSYVQKEVDFVVNHGDRKLYIQTAFQMGTEQKESAELDSLKLTGDFFKKIIVRMDIPHNFYDDNGIFHCNLIDFLLERVDLF